MPAPGRASTAGAAGAAAPDLEALKEGMMKDLEVRMALNEESLWRRGQAELKKLQKEHQQLRGVVGEVRERQAGLIVENQELRRGIMEIASKFELVIKEMREVLRALPQQQQRLASGGALAAAFAAPVFRPSPASASTNAIDAMRDDCRPLSEQTSAGTATPIWSAERAAAGMQSTPSAVWHPQADTPQLGEPSEVALAGFRTPRRDMAEAPRAASPSRAAASTAPAGLAAPAPATPAPGLTQACQGPTERRVQAVRVELVKEPGFVTLGMSVVEDGGALLVEGIDDHALVWQHNAMQDSDATRVLRGDSIIEANGVSNDANGILQQCQQARRIRLTLARPCAPTPGRMRPEAQEFVPAALGAVVAGAAASAAAAGPAQADDATERLVQRLFP